MLSKIMVDVQEDGSPCITVRMPSGANWSEDISASLPDKMLKRFFERIGHESQFIGVLADRHEPNAIKTLIPLDLGNTLEWVERIIRSNNDTPELALAFDEIWSSLGVTRMTVELMEKK